MVHCEERNQVPVGRLRLPVAVERLSVTVRGLPLG